MKREQLQIELVSPEQILSWSERILPNGKKVGQVTKARTIDYVTNQPIRGGLFCERIFGPKKRGVCACENPEENEKKNNKPKNEKKNNNSNFCEKCEVELFIDPRIRRYRMGYIKLACPVVHIWYFQRRPSYIADLLDKSRKELEGPVYCDICLARPIANKPTLLRLHGLIRQYEHIVSLKYIASYLSWNFALVQEREIATGGKAIKEQLAGLDLQMILDRSYIEWKKIDGRISIVFSEEENNEELRELYNSYQKQLISLQRRKNRLVRRMRLAQYFIRANVEPQWMVLCLLPVLPPDLRPMFQLNEGGMLVSDLNELYCKVIRINNSLLRSIKGNSLLPLPNLFYKQNRKLQKAVDALLDNSIGAQPVKDNHDRPYKSFSDFIQGKEGRFRQNLLGKRVDYSGRSVIVVGPHLSLYQCGLPREMAIELFQIFLIRDLVERQIAPNLRAAKILIQDRGSIIWNMLKQIIQRYPILLNRAPTLHRLGIQAFLPVLIEERAIRLHPLVCAGFNADFDGDQMAVHIPLSMEAQVEARLLMFSHLNLISPTIGDPICVPTQDMLLGLYRSTFQKNEGVFENRYSSNNSQKKIVSPSFYSYDDALKAYEHQQIDLDSPLWLRWRRDIDTSIINSVNRELPIEVQYESLGTFYEIYDSFRIRKGRVGEILNKYIRTTVGRIRFNREIEEAIKGLWAYEFQQELSLFKI